MVGYAEFDGLRFIGRIGVEPARDNGYNAKNTLLAASHAGPARLARGRAGREAAAWRLPPRRRHSRLSPTGVTKIAKPAWAS